MIGDYLRDNGLAGLGTVATGGHLRLTVCAGDPTSYSEANTLESSGGLRVGALLTLAAGDVTLGNKSGGGRQSAIAAKSLLVEATTTSTALYWALLDVTNSRLLATGGAGTRALDAISDELQLSAFTVYSA
jgi:hypothetical protein